MNWISKAKGLNLEVRDFIGGRWSACEGPQVPKRSARDGKLLYEIGAGSPVSIERAVKESRAAFDDGRWSRRTVQFRKRVLLELAARVEAHADELALLECLDVGKPISDARNVDIPMAVALLRHAAEAAANLNSRVFDADVCNLSYQLRRPLGVVAGIVGWNFPLVLAASKVGPALAMGNCLILKPSELTSLSTARLAELAVEAGLPEGVLNVIHGGPTLGAALGKHPGVDLVTFTGSSNTGKQLMIAAGESNMKRLILECGGKAPNIVFNDSPDLNGVADAIVARAFWNQGQVCTASSRLLVQNDIRGELLPLIVQRVGKLRLGDPLMPDTTFGPLVSKAHQQKVLGYIDVGVKEGARTLFSSECRPPATEGFYVGPVVFDDVKPEARIAQEEIFGPVLSVISFGTEDEAIQIANGTLYGLSATLWTTDLGRAHRVTQGVRAGWITVNATATPGGGPGVGILAIGGHKESGLGVEGGHEGLEAYTCSTAVQYFV